MSRSYKRTPVCKDGNASKKRGKKIVNKKIRKTTDLGQKSNLYKKGYESWNICDYRFYEDCKAEFNVEDINFWKKWYFRK